MVTIFSVSLRIFRIGRLVTFCCTRMFNYYCFIKGINGIKVLNILFCCVRVFRSVSNKKTQLSRLKTSLNKFYVCLYSIYGTKVDLPVNPFRIMSSVITTPRVRTVLLSLWVYYDGRTRVQRLDQPDLRLREKRGVIKHTDTHTENCDYTESMDSISPSS